MSLLGRKVTSGTGLGLASLSPKFAAAYILANFAVLPRYVPGDNSPNDEAIAAQIRANADAPIADATGALYSPEEKARIVRKVETRRVSLGLEKKLPGTSGSKGDALKESIGRMRENKGLLTAINRSRSSDPAVRQAAMAILGNPANSEILDAMERDLRNIDNLRRQAKPSSTEVLPGESAALRAQAREGKPLPPIIKPTNKEGKSAVSGRGALRYNNTPAEVPFGEETAVSKRMDALGKARAEINTKRKAADAEEYRQEILKNAGKGRATKSARQSANPDIREEARKKMKAKQVKAAVDREIKKQQTKEMMRPVKKAVDATKRYVSNNKGGLLAGLGASAVVGGVGLGAKALSDRREAKAREDAAYERYLASL